MPISLTYNMTKGLFKITENYLIKIISFQEEFDPNAVLIITKNGFTVKHFSAFPKKSIVVTPWVHDRIIKIFSGSPFTCRLYGRELIVATLT